MKIRKQSARRLSKYISNLLLLGLLFIVPNLIPLAAATLQITVIQSSENRYFEQTKQSLDQLLDDSFIMSVINVDAIDTQHQKLKTSDIIITLGIDAALNIAKKYDAKKIISAYITLKQQQRHEDELENHSIILLDQPLSRYLAFTALILHPHSVGIISTNKLTLNKKQKKILSEFDFNFQQYEYHKRDNPLTTVRQLLKNNDVHLLLPDDSVYNRRTLKGILLTSYRSRKPVISYSPSHVKAGALASIFSSPSDIGSQLASVVRRLTKKPSQSKAIIEFAQYFSITVNNRVAHALGINLPDEVKLTDKLNELSQ